MSNDEDSPLIDQLYGAQRIIREAIRLSISTYCLIA
jgi:hypothetical protein